MDIIDSDIHRLACTYNRFFYVLQKSQLVPELVQITVDVMESYEGDSDTAGLTLDELRYLLKFYNR